MKKSGLQGKWPHGPRLAAPALAFAAAKASSVAFAAATLQHADQPPAADPPTAASAAPFWPPAKGAGWRHGPTLTACSATS